MKTYYRLADIPPAGGRRPGTAVALGFFDGVHTGHRAVIDAAVDWAKHSGLAPAAFSFTLPAGRYDALRVELGAHAGRNWFCVLYPALCLSAAQPAEYPQAAQQEILENSQGYEVRFAALEAVERVQTAMDEQLGFFAGRQVVVMHPALSYLALDAGLEAPAVYTCTNGVAALTDTTFSNIFLPNAQPPIAVALSVSAATGDTNSTFLIVGTFFAISVVSADPYKNPE